MDQLSFNQLVTEYGLYGALLLFMWDKYGSRIMDALFVERKARREAEERREQDERKALEEYERSDRRREQETYDRFAKSMERFADSLNVLSQTMIVISERLNRVERDQDSTRSAVVVIAERIGMQKADPKN